MVRCGTGWLRQCWARFGEVRQVGLVLLRPVALRFVGNGQGKAGLAGKAGFVDFGLGPVR